MSDEKILFKAEEFFDDQGTCVKRMTPVSQGAVMAGEPVKYLGVCFGPNPIFFNLEATSLPEAFDKAPSVIRNGMAQLSALRAKQEADKKSKPILLLPGMQ